MPSDAVARILDPAVESEFRLEDGADRATWRGATLPVVGLWATPIERVAPRVFLLLQGSGGHAVLPVDAAEAIRDVPADAIAPLPGFIFADGRRLVRGLFYDGAEPRLLLDAGAFA